MNVADPSPGTTNQITAPPMVGPFIAYLQVGGTHKHGCDWVLSRSPEPHQILPASTPQPCTRDHQKGWDLEGVVAATNTPHINHLPHFKTMSELNTQAPIIELTDDQLELVEEGSFDRVAAESIVFPSGSSHGQREDLPHINDPCTDNQPPAPPRASVWSVGSCR